MQAEGQGRRTIKHGRRLRPAPSMAVVTARQHPALQARWRATNLRRWLGVTAFAACAAACVAMLLRSPAFFVRRVRVEGISALLPAEAEAVREAAAVPPRTNLFRANTRALVASIEKLPWVRSASVSRRPPGTLRIHVQPRLPAALVVAAGSRWEVDRSGVPIRIASRAPTGLLVISLADDVPLDAGRRLASQGATAGLQLARMIASDAGRRVAKITVDRDAELCLNMDDGIVIRLGQSDDLPAKYSLVQRIYRESPDIAAQVASIDLRCADAPACTPRAAGSQPQQQVAVPLADRQQPVHPSSASRGSSRDMAESTEKRPRHRR